MDVLSQAYTLQHTALECIRIWNSAFLQPEEQAIQTFSQANERKRALEKDCHKLTLSEAKTPQEEAELLIALLLSSVMVSVPEMQRIVDHTCRLLQSLANSPLKTRLLIAFYTLTQDEEDKEEILKFLTHWEKKELNEDEKKTIELYREVEQWTNVNL